MIPLYSPTSDQPASSAEKRPVASVALRPSELRVADSYATNIFQATPQTEHRVVCYRPLAKGVRLTNVLVVKRFLYNRTEPLHFTNLPVFVNCPAKGPELCLSHPTPS